jgi:hypothetical protein
MYIITIYYHTSSFEDISRSPLRRNSIPGPAKPHLVMLPAHSTSAQPAWGWQDRPRGRLDTSVSGARTITATKKPSRTGQDAEILMFSQI